MALALVRFLRVSPFPHVHTFQVVSDSFVDVKNEVVKSLNVNLNKPYPSELFQVVCFVIEFLCEGSH